MKKAVAYMRYSSHNQDERSIEYQRAAITAYCLMNGVEIVEEYVDEAYSATTDRRPDFQRLIKDARSHPAWDTVLIYDQSRFARNNGDATNYENELNDLNIELISVTQLFGDSNEGFLLKGVTNLMNEMYSRNNGKTTHAAMMVKASKGKHCGGKPPLGYDLDEDENLVVNEHEAEIVRMIFNMFEMDYSYSRMAQVLNDAGCTTKAGNPFNKYSFNEILTREKYAGTYIWNQARQKNSKAMRNSHQKKPVEKQVRIEDGCPQIITKEQFQKTQEILAARAKGRAGSKRRHHYMLSGLKIMKCAECGSYMIGTARTSHGKDYTTYACPNHKSNGCAVKEIRTEYVDKMVAGLIVQDLAHRDDLASISRQMKNGNETHKLQDKKRGVEKAIAGVMKAIEKSCSDTLVTRLDQLEAEKASLDRAIAKSKLANPGITAENKKKLCRSFAHYLTKTDDPDAKIYLKSMVKEILVSNEDVSIKLNIA